MALVSVETRAALAAARRHGRITGKGHAQARDRLAVRMEQMTRIGVGDDLIATACELAEQEALHSLDAIHLAAALELAPDVFACADDELCDAARRRGLGVVNPLDEVGPER